MWAHVPSPAGGSTGTRAPQFPSSVPTRFRSTAICRREKGCCPTAGRPSSTCHRPTISAPPRPYFSVVKADLILARGQVRTLGRDGLSVHSHLAIAGGLVVAAGGAD